jgi:hypothetical protein
MGSHKMIVGSPPVRVGQEVWGLLSGGSGATCQLCWLLGTSVLERRRIIH